MTGARPLARLLVLSTDPLASSFLHCQLRGMTGGDLELVVTDPQTLMRERLLDDPAHPVALIIIPGARSSDRFREPLAGAGFDRLRRYVYEGGAIIGICQGFYLLSETIAYVDAHGTESKGSRTNLGLLPGITVGSLRPELGPATSHYEGWHSTTTAGIELRAPGRTDFTRIDCLYWGGPAYLPAGNATDVVVLGRYNHPQLPGGAAVAARNVGQGLVIGISPHLEISSAQLQTTPHLELFDRDDGSYRKMLAEKLAGSDTMRSFAFNRLVANALNTPIARRALAAPLAPRPLHQPPVP